MSERHPIIAITGSSGAGTSTVTRTFQNIFRREELTAAVIEGELEHAYRAAPVGTFGGGVNEVQREIIAMVGLGMPRAPR